jgi:hypothetical protein
LNESSVRIRCVSNLHQERLSGRGLCDRNGRSSSALNVRTQCVNNLRQERLSTHGLYDKKGLNHSSEQLSHGLLRYKDSNR